MLVEIVIVIVIGDRVLVHQSMDPVACVRHAAVLQCGKSNGEQRGTAAAT